jgi:transposase
LKSEKFGTLADAAFAALSTSLLLDRKRVSCLMILNLEAKEVVNGVTCLGIMSRDPRNCAPRSVFSASYVILSFIQALDRLDPVLPLSPGRAERHGFEYYRHGTLSLYAALNTRTGQVLGQTTPRHTSTEFVGFLGQIVASQPKEKEIHIIADNLSAHKTKEVSAFLQANSNVRIHYTPTYSSWLNQVEIWFSKIQRQTMALPIETEATLSERKAILTEPSPT